MITNNPDTRSLEELAGVPNAAELEQLANEYFPDLTDSAYAATPAAPEVQNASAAQISVRHPGRDRAGGG